MNDFLWQKSKVREFASVPRGASSTDGRPQRRQRRNSLVDEVHSLRFELVGAVQVGEDEDLCGVLHGQARAQRVLAHHLQPLQSVLPTPDGSGGTAERIPDYFNCADAKTKLEFK